MVNYIPMYDVFVQQVHSSEAYRNVTYKEREEINKEKKLTKGWEVIQ